MVVIWIIFEEVFNITSLMLVDPEAIIRKQTEDLHLSVYATFCVACTMCFETSWKNLLHFNKQIKTKKV